MRAVFLPTPPHPAYLMKRLGLFSALIALAACRDGTRAVSPTVIARGPASGANIATALETVYGPERFTRTTGAPDVYRRVISTEGFEAPFVLRLRNGAAGGRDRKSVV